MTMLTSAVSRRRLLAVPRCRVRTVRDRPRDRGSLSLEQAIVTAVLSAAAIALGVVIVNAITSHSAQIR